MGMFDYFRSSYDLGPQFTDVDCQTKDMEKGIGGTMSQYWLDPAGKLWVMTYRDTHDMEIYEKGHPRYNEDRAFLNFEWIPNGNHGKVEPYYITDYVEVYPATWDRQWEDWPTCRIHFESGMIKSFQRRTNNERHSEFQKSRRRG
jgi:hypothetical protein